MLLTNNFHDLQIHRVKIKAKLEQGERFFKHLDNDIILFILSVFNSYAYFWDMLILIEIVVITCIFMIIFSSSRCGTFDFI